MNTSDTEYAGFWMRVVASCIDMVLVFCITFPILFLISGWGFRDLVDHHIVADLIELVISWVLPAVAIVFFWLRKQATPGKMLLAMRVVDATTGGPLTLKQAVIRCVGYVLSAAPLGFGFAWMAFDPRKQGLHDKLANTIVIQPSPPAREEAPEPDTKSEPTVPVAEIRPDDTFLRA